MMPDLPVPTPTYTTPELVAEAIGVPSPDGDRLGIYQFSDTSVPRYDYVCRTIVASEGRIDRHLNRSWRENFVKERILTINTYQWDQNGMRAGYWLRGGNYLQLHKDVLPWDPQKGDRLWLRDRTNAWREYTFSETDPMQGSWNGFDGLENASFWIDHKAGRLFLRNRLFQSPYNAVKISYRYGSTDPVPEEIVQLCTLMTADQVIGQMSTFFIKIGAGGDISGVKEALHQQYQETMASVASVWQRSGSVRSMLG